MTTECYFGEMPETNVYRQLKALRKAHVIKPDGNGVKKPRGGPFPIVWRIAEAKRFLTEKFGWQWYGGHHMENKYTIFVGNYLHPRKFGIDLRLIEFSALIRSGQLWREGAFRGLEKPPYMDTSILREVEMRLNIDIDEIMALPKKTHNDYETYQQTFRNLEPVFSILHRMGRIPSTFYLKYVKGV